MKDDSDTREEEATATKALDAAIAAMGSMDPQARNKRGHRQNVLALLEAYKAVDGVARADRRNVCTFHIVATAFAICTGEIEREFCHPYSGIGEGYLLFSCVHVALFSLSEVSGSMDSLRELYPYGTECVEELAHKIRGDDDKSWDPIDPREGG